jgi:hypothetical protein
MPILWNQPGLLWSTPTAVWNGDGAPNTTSNKRKTMSAIVLNIKGLNDLEIEAKLRALATSQTNNPTAATGLTITNSYSSLTLPVLGEVFAVVDMAEGRQRAVDRGLETIVNHCKPPWPRRTIRRRTYVGCDRQASPTTA